MRLPILLGALVVAALASAVSACTPFASDSAGDGGLPVNDASGSDGPGNGADGGTRGGTCDAAGADFCDDFERDGWQSRWKASADSITATPGDATSGTKSIELAPIVGIAPKAIVHTLGPGKVLTIAVQMRVLTAGGGETDLIAITDTISPTAGGRGVSVVRPGGGESYAVEVAAPGGGPATQVLNSTFSQWTKVTITVDLGSHEYICDVSGEIPEHFQGPLDKTWNPTTLYVQLGAFYQPSLTMPWHVRFDDAAVTTKQ